MLSKDLEQMKRASRKSFFDMIIAELSNKVEIPLGLSFEGLLEEAKSNVKAKSIFGANLTFEGVCQINQLIAHIRRPENITIEGLFRKSGSRARQNELVEKLASANLEIDLNSPHYSIHDVCCVLKRFITELPQPLLTDVLPELFLQTNSISVPENRLDAIRLLILLLPDTNSSLLDDLFQMFEQIVKHSDTNLMTADNLSLIFAPMFFFKSDVEPEILKESLTKITSCLKYMIDNAAKIFTPPTSIESAAHVFVQKLKTSQNLQSTTSLIPHTKLCATDVKHEPSDYTKQMMAELFAELQKTVNEKGNKNKKMFSAKRQKELLKMATTQNTVGTPLVKLERHKEQQELIKKHLANKKTNGFKQVSSALKKTFFTPKKYQLQGSPGSASRRRRSMEFKQSPMDTPKVVSIVSTPSKLPTPKSNKNRLSQKKLFTPKQTPTQTQTQSPAAPPKTPVMSPPPELMPKMSERKQVPPPLPPKTPSVNSAIKENRRRSLRPYRSSPHPRSISSGSLSCQKENRPHSVSTKSLPCRSRNPLILPGARGSRVRNLVAKHEAMVAEAAAKASSASLPRQSSVEYVQISRIPMSSRNSGRRKSRSSTSLTSAQQQQLDRVEQQSFL